MGVDPKRGKTILKMELVRAHFATGDSYQVRATAKPTNYRHWELETDWHSEPEDALFELSENIQEEWVGALA